MDIIDASGRLRHGWWLLAALLAAAALVFSACSTNVQTFRYRLGFAVEVDGEVKSASSIIQVWYEQYGSQNAAGARGGSWYRGVAPVIDLGSHGYLIASMSADCNYPKDSELRFQKSPVTTSKVYGKVCKPPSYASELPKAFGLHAIELEKLRDGKRDLAGDNYPPFIWIAQGGSWRETKRICPEEFESVIGADVKLKSVSIEAAPKAALLHKLEIQAPWIDAMRSDFGQNKHYDVIADFCRIHPIYFEW
jgi:hypothetical protein